jgi:hypothetical protein
MRWKIKKWRREIVIAGFWQWYPEWVRYSYVPAGTLPDLIFLSHHTILPVKVG